MIWLDSHGLKIRATRLREWEVVKSWRYKVVKLWNWNLLLDKKILHYAALRSEWEGYVFCSRLGIWIIYWNAKIIYFLYVFKGAKLAKFIRFEVGWKVCLFSFTKFTENWWNDCVFYQPYSVCPLPWEVSAPRSLLFFWSHSA